MRTNVLFVNAVGLMGGAERSLLSVASRLDRRRFAAAVACPAGELSDLVEAEDLPCYCVDFRRFHRTFSPMHLARQYYAWRRGRTRLERIVREGRFHILHANGASAQLYAGPAARACGARCVWHVRDLSHLFPVGGYCARRADAIVCISQAVADVVRPLAPDPSQVRVIHNGIDADAFAAAARGGSIRTEFRWPPSAFVAAMIAQFVPWKRHHDFLDALARAVRSAPGLRGIVAGDDLFGDHPDLGRQLREAAYDLGLSDRVVFTGRRSDVPDLIAASNVVVIASEAEPFGRVALEAMAFGKPVVGTSAGGLPEVVGHEETGLLVPPRRPDAIAEALLRLVQDPALAERLGRCGHARVRERFALAEAVRRTEALYDEIAAAPPEGGR